MNDEGDELLEVIEDDQSTEEKGAIDNRQPWKILIVDDDEFVHDITLYSLKDKEIFDRPLSFLHAYSAEEAFNILQKETDVSVMLLDVVMETEDAGLKLVPRVREDLNQQQIRIILRTGQPGYAPEEQVVSEYDINDYQIKSEFSYQKMMTALRTALRNYIELQRVSSSGRVLQKIIYATEELLQETSVEGFAEIVLKTLSQLFSQPLQGFVVVQPAGTSLGLVVAASGKFSKMRYRDVHAIADERLTGGVRESLRSGKSSQEHKEYTLNFNNQENPMVACINPTTGGAKLISKQYHIDLFIKNVSLCLSKLSAQAYKGLADKQIK